MDKKILLQSSASNEIYNNNTLSKFSNKLPISYLSPHLKWHVALESVGFQAGFFNPGVSNGNRHPALIQVPREYLEIWDINNDMSFDLFKPHNQFFLDEKQSYTLKSLDLHLREYVLAFMRAELRSFSGFPTTYDANTDKLHLGQFRFFFDKLSEVARDKYRNFVFLHHKFFKALKIENVESVNFSSCRIDGIQYQWFHVAEDCILPIISSCEGLQVKTPKIIKVISNAVSDILDNNKLSKVIKIFPLRCESVDTFVHIDFGSHEWFQLKDTSSIDICLKDENDNDIRVLSGTPTYIKLHCSSTTNTIMNQFHVRISSEKSVLNPQNEAHIFGHHLAKRKDLSHGRYKVALTSILVPKKLLMFESLDLSFGGTLIDNFNTTTSAVSSTIPLSNPPRNLKSCQEILNFFKSHKPNFIKVVENESGLLILEFKKRGRLKIGSHLAIIFGHNKLESLMIDRDGGQVYVFPRKMQDIEIRPTSLYLYCNFVDNSLVGGELLKLLKHIPLKEREDVNDDYVSIQFELHEFLNVSTTELSELYFQLHCNNGEYATFLNHDTKTVHLDLLFQKF